MHIRKQIYDLRRMIGAQLEVIDGIEARLNRLDPAVEIPKTKPMTRAEARELIRKAVSRSSDTWKK